MGTPLLRLGCRRGETCIAQHETDQGLCCRWPEASERNRRSSSQRRFGSPYKVGRLNVLTLNGRVEVAAVLGASVGGRAIRAGAS
jgi:hypothetical protein